MNKISCDICMDLIPLVKDGVASEESCQAVREHLKECEECRKYYDGGEIPEADSDKIYQKLRHRMQILTSIMMMGIFFGLSLTAQEDMFYNILIMPVIGALGYFVFHWKALFNVPILLLIIHIFTNFFGMFRGIQHFELLSLLMWTGIYAAFAVMGVLIAGLLHFAFQKEDAHEK